MKSSDTFQSRSRSRVRAATCCSRFSFSACSAISARLRSVMSICAPTRRKGCPSASRSICERTWIQRIWPSLGRMMRYSALYSVASPRTARTKACSVLSRSSGWMRRTQSSCDSFTASGGRPWILRYSGERRFLKPSVRKTSTPPTCPMSCTRASSASRSRKSRSRAATRSVVSTAVTRTPPIPSAHGIVRHRAVAAVK